MVWCMTSPLHSKLVSRKRYICICVLEDLLKFKLFYAEKFLWLTLKFVAMCASPDLRFFQVHHDILLVRSF